MTHPQQYYYANEDFDTTLNNTSVLNCPKKKQKRSKKKNEKPKLLDFKAVINLKKSIEYIDSLPLPIISSNIYKTSASKDSFVSISVAKYLRNFRDGFISVNKNWNKGVGGHYGVIGLSMTEMGDYSIEWGFISRDDTVTLCSLRELANILDNEADRFIQTEHFKEITSQSLAKVSVMLSIVSNLSTIKEDYNLFYKPFKTTRMKHNSSMVNESMCSIDNQMICLVSSLSIRLATNQLYTNTITTICDRRLCQRSLQSAQNAKSNQVTLMFDFPCMLSNKK